MTRQQFLEACAAAGLTAEAAQATAQKVDGLIAYRRRELLDELETLEASSYAGILETIRNKHPPNPTA